MLSKLKLLILLLVPMAQPAYAERYGDPSILIETADVDIQRYLGLWHEAARYENRFERDCIKATAEYSLRPDGDIKVVNTCWRTELDNSRSVTGKAWIVGEGKLKVSFINIPLLSRVAAGDYYVIHTDYDTFAIVGNPSKKYGWLLTRDSKISNSQFDNYMKWFDKSGYDISKIKRMF